MRGGNQNQSQKSPRAIRRIRQGVRLHTSGGVDHRHTGHDCLEERPQQRSRRLRHCQPCGIAEHISWRRCAHTTCKVWGFMCCGRKQHPCKEQTTSVVAARPQVLQCLGLYVPPRASIGARRKVHLGRARAVLLVDDDVRRYVGTDGRTKTRRV